ncbi:MAG: hypothetical protein J6X02_05665, partial [Bacilli bacterium]|nr:hypothetical protein [Bacilli bacterium]
KGPQPGMAGAMPGGMGGMMPGMMGMPMTSAPFVPGGLRPSGPTNMDEYLRRLDEQIAKLEAEQKEEERLERERFEAKNKEVDKVINEASEVDNKEKLQDEIEEILDHKVEKPVVNVNITTSEPVKVEEKPESDDVVVTLPTYEEVEKPKINIDVDSVVVNNEKKPESDDFFDDFFGGEDD